MQHNNNEPNHIVFCAQVGVGAKCKKGNCVSQKNRYWQGVGCCFAPKIQPRPQSFPEIKKDASAPSVFTDELQIFSQHLSSSLPLLLRNVSNCCFRSTKCK